MRETCRLFGLRATGANLASMEAVLDGMLTKDVMQLQEEKVSRGDMF